MEFYVVGSYGKRYTGNWHCTLFAIDIAVELAHLDISKQTLWRWRSHDGSGLQTRDACVDLANALEQFLPLIPGAYADERDALNQIVPLEQRGDPYELDSQDIINFIRFLRRTSGFSVW
ncbi:MAG: hypothetical protein Q8O67_17065 [Deltaproteobacteria bacterium]|nr:hypothetical protein [Deltaproteobacteria bacterium]